MSALGMIQQHFGCKLVLSKEEVATYLGYKTATLQKMIEKRDTALKDLFYKAGKSWVCDSRDLAEFVEANQHKHLDSSPLTTSGEARAVRRVLPVGTY